MPYKPGKEGYLTEHRSLLGQISLIAAHFRMLN